MDSRQITTIDCELAHSLANKIERLAMDTEAMARDLNHSAGASELELAIERLYAAADLVTKSRRTMSEYVVPLVEVAAEVW